MVKCPAGPHRPDGIGNICRTWLAAGPVLLSVDDEFEDSLFDVLTQTGPINDVPRTPWSFQFVADEQTDVLTAVSQYQVLSFTLTHTHTHTHTHRRMLLFLGCGLSARHVDNVTSTHSHTRNSAVAVKPRDALVQYVMALLTSKTRSPPISVTTPNSVVQMVCRT